jgi:hypothetical protein
MVEMEWTVAEEGKEDRGGAGVVVGPYVPACRKARGHSKTFSPGCMGVRVSGAPRHKELMVLAVIRLRLFSNVSSSDQRVSTFSRGIWTAR